MKIVPLNISRNVISFGGVVVTVQFISTSQNMKLKKVIIGFVGVVTGKQQGCIVNVVGTNHLGGVIVHCARIGNLRNIQMNGIINLDKPKKPTYPRVYFHFAKYY